VSHTCIIYTAKEETGFHAGVKKLGVQEKFGEKKSRMTRRKEAVASKYHESCENQQKPLFTESRNQASNRFFFQMPLLCKMSQGHFWKKKTRQNIHKTKKKTGVGAKEEKYWSVFLGTEKWKHVVGHEKISGFPFCCQDWVKSGL